jgi:hydroxyacylglutathione hydrolase
MTGHGENYQKKHRNPLVVCLKMRRQLFVNYNYLLVCPATREAVIIDPAWELDKVKSALDATGSSLVGILLTHSHYDHIDLAAALSSIYQCSIWMSREEQVFSNYRHPNLQLIDGKTIAFGKMLVHPIKTPGHTPGCVCYKISDNLFTGDVLFAEGCGLCPDADGAACMYESLNQLKNLIEPTTKIYPGHSFGKAPGQSFASLLKDNIYLQFDDSLAFIKFRMRKKQDELKFINFS